MKGTGELHTIFATAWETNHFKIKNEYRQKDMVAVLTDVTIYKMG